MRARAFHFLWSPRTCGHWFWYMGRGKKADCNRYRATSAGASQRTTTAAATKARCPTSPTPFASSSAICSTAPCRGTTTGRVWLGIRIRSGRCSARKAGGLSMMFWWRTIRVGVPAVVMVVGSDGKGRRVEVCFGCLGAIGRRRRMPVCMERWLLCSLLRRELRPVDL